MKIQIILPGRGRNERGDDLIDNSNMSISPMNGDITRHNSNNRNVNKKLASTDSHDFVTPPLLSQA